MGKIEDKIEVLEKELIQFEEENFKRVNLIYSLIQLKKNSENSEIIKTIYVDVKLFIKTYIKSIENRDCGYDLLQPLKILTAINYVNNLNDRFNLLTYAYRNLKINEFESESDFIKDEINKTKTKILNSKRKYFSSLIHQCSYDLKSIAITVLTLFLFTNLILWPAPYKFMEVYEITYANYSSNFSVNHILNIIAKIGGVNDSFNVEINSIIGLFFLLLIKLLYIIFIVNFLFEKLKELIQK